MLEAEVQRGVLRASGKEVGRRRWMDGVSILVMKKFW